LLDPLYSTRRRAIIGLPRISVVALFIIFWCRYAVAAITPLVILIDETITIIVETIHAYLPCNCRRYLASTSKFSTNRIAFDDSRLADSYAFCAWRTIVTRYVGFDNGRVTSLCANTIILGAWITVVLNVCDIRFVDRSSHSVANHFLAIARLLSQQRNAVFHVMRLTRAILTAGANA
jgi:hypothetical protein